MPVFDCIFYVKNRQNFFDYEHFSAYGKTEALTHELLQLKRHDKIKVKGRN
jgi:hypothetical protein